MRAILAGVLALGIPTGYAAADVPQRQVEMVRASYYGPGFDGRATASGCRFDQWSNTAASRTLPLGTVLRVTNPANGRSELVIILDRGPYVHGRTLDLSRGTARRLGIEAQGVATVHLERLQ